MTIELSEYVIDAIADAVVKKMQDPSYNSVKTELEPCEDAISRQAVIDALTKTSGIRGDALKALYDLPLVSPMPRWIPVSERLPEDGQEILFSTKTGRVHCGRYHDDNSANKWYSYRDKCRAWNNVVDAWMPLPTPYQQEVEE